MITSLNKKERGQINRVDIEDMVYIRRVFYHLGPVGAPDDTIMYYVISAFIILSHITLDPMFNFCVLVFEWGQPLFLVLY